MSDAPLARMRSAISRGRTHEAAVAAEEVLLDDPSAPEARMLLGQLAERRGAIGKAARHFAHLATHPSYAVSSGSALVRAGLYEQSIAHFIQGMDAGDDPLGAALRLAWVFERLDRFDDMEETLGSARALAQRQGRDVTVREAILRARTKNWRSSLAILDKATDLAGEDRLARGRLRDRARRYDEAWADFIGGKEEIAQQSRTYYPDESLAAHFTQLQACFSRSWPARIAEIASPTDNTEHPIFIAGAPRSGTTLIERHVGSDPTVATLGELPCTFAMASEAARIEGGYPSGLSSLGASALAAAAGKLRSAYLNCAKSRAAPLAKRRFTDKMPFNEQYLPLIALALPESPMIVVSRHPLDVIVSMMSHHMTHGHNCALSPLSAARHIAALDRLGDHWQTIGLHYHRVRYEDFVTKRSTALNELEKFAGLDLSHTAELAPGSTASTPSYGQVRERVHDRAIGRWRNYAPYLESAAGIVAGAAARHHYEPWQKA